MIHQAAGRVPRPQGLHTYPPLVGDEPDNFPMIIKTGQLDVEKDIASTIKAGQLDVEGIFSQLTGRPEATEGLAEAWGDVGKSQMYRLQNCWRTKLKVELLRFAHSPLLTYCDCGEEATGEGTAATG